MMHNAGIRVLCFALCVFLAGCSSEAVNKDRENTFLNATDLVRMTDQMAASIASDANVARIKKPMVIVIKPIENDTNEIIRPGEKEMYVHRVRVRLSGERALAGQFEFVLNRADYEKLRSEEGVAGEELGASEERVVPEYALKGVFYSQTNAGSKGRSDMYLCTYQLTKLSGPEAGKIVWEGTYQTKKHVEKRFLD